MSPTSHTYLVTPVTAFSLFPLFAFLLYMRLYVRGAGVEPIHEQLAFYSSIIFGALNKDVLRLFVYVYIFLCLYTVKKVRKFPVPSRDVTTKLSLGGNNDVITELFPPRGSLVSGGNS